MKQTIFLFIFLTLFHETDYFLIYIPHNITHILY